MSPIRPGIPGFARIARICVMAAVLVLLTVLPTFSQWQIQPEVRIGGGYESDLVIDPGLARTVVPGGSFMELAPALTARRWLGGRGLASLGAFATIQQFINDDSRRLFAQTVRGDLFYSFESIRGRWSANLSYFDDSKRETVRRLGAGTELGLAWIQPGWHMELWGGLNGRQYPEITVVTSSNQANTYGELAWSGGATLGLRPAERVNCQLSGMYQFTDSDDFLFDSNSWTAMGNLDTRLVSSLYLTVSGTYQERDFTNRLAGLDKDKYWQIGSGFRYTLAPGWTAAVRGGFSIYTWTDGAAEDAHRVTVAFSYSWGRRTAIRPPRVDVGSLVRESGGSVQQPDVEGNVHLRVHAPGARNVSVAGDFNGWQPDRAPLRPAGNGWWEIHISLEPGSYEYLYIIDGRWVAPPEAKLLVNDGFGGQNGILEVLPPGL